MPYRLRYAARLQAFLKHYAVSRVDDNFEGILWLKFCPLNGGPEFLGCVCYLPPIESTRNIDGGEFFDTLLCQIHMYCKSNVFFLCGDYNARCASLDDFIAGVDKIEDREVIDFTTNKYGKLLCEF